MTSMGHPKGRLQGRVAIVTGGGIGIGRAIAHTFGREGANLVVDYLHHADEAENLADEVRELGGEALTVQADVGSTEGAQRIVERALEKFGGVDILVNNSGIEESRPFLETSFEVWQRVIAVDLTGPWLCTQAAARAMVERKGNGKPRGGRIINISSVHEDLPMPKNAPYCAAKGGLRMLMRTLAVELAPHGITVNNIAPGAIATSINRDVREDPKKREALIAEIPLRRIGEANEVADLCLYLASDRSSYVTGSTYVIDGGLMRHSGSL